MASIVIQGDTSGSVTLQAPAIAGSTTITLPSTSGTLASIASVNNNGVVYANSSGQPTTSTGFVFDGSNLGLGVTPSAWGGSYKGLQVNSTGALTSNGSNSTGVGHNYYYDGTNNKYLTTGAANAYLMINNEHRWYTAPSGTAGTNITFTQAMTLDASGRLVIGATSTSAKFQVSGASANTYLLIDNAASGENYYAANATHIFQTAGSERARIDSSGNLLVGTTSSSDSVGAGIKLRPSLSASVVCQTFDTSNGGAGTYILYNLNATNNGYRFYVAADGGIRNYSANNSNLSDQRTKTDIQDAGGYLSKICAIPVRTFKYKDQTDDLLNLGVIAQEVEAVAPELVDVSGFGETPEDGVPLKAIYQTDLQYALMKCIQELNAKVEAQAAEIAALKGAA